MPTEFYFEMQYRCFNSDYKTTITLLHRCRNTRQWQVRFKSVSFGVRISNSPLRRRRLSDCVRVRGAQFEHNSDKFEPNCYTNL